MPIVSFIYALVLVTVNRAMGKKLSIGRRVKIHPFASIDPDQGSITIGDGTIIQRGAILKAYRGKIVLGTNCSVNPYTILYGHGGLDIGNDVRIAAHVVAVPADHIYEKRSTPIFQSGEHRRGIHIGDDVWIGAGAKILDGAHVASGCVIGANSVLKAKTEPYGVYVGAPASLVKFRT